jgi:hypothetical protein
MTSNVVRNVKDVNERMFKQSEQKNVGKFWEDVGLDADPTSFADERHLQMQVH